MTDLLGELAIGTVDSVTGTATSTRADGSVVTLVEGDPVFADELIGTAADATIGIVFVDGTVLSLGGDSRIVLDELVYDPQGADGALTFSVVEGVFVFVSGAIAKTGPDAMMIETPVASIGIRGTVLGLSYDRETERLDTSLMPEIDPLTGAPTVGEIVVAVVAPDGTVLAVETVNMVGRRLSVVNNEASTAAMTVEQAGDLFGPAMTPTLGGTAVDPSYLTPGSDRGEDRRDGEDDATLQPTDPATVPTRAEAASDAPTVGDGETIAPWPSPALALALPMAVSVSLEQAEAVPMPPADAAFDAAVMQSALGERVQPGARMFDPDRSATPQSSLEPEVVSVTDLASATATRPSPEAAPAPTPQPVPPPPVETPPAAPDTPSLAPVTPAPEDDSAPELPGAAAPTPDRDTDAPPIVSPGPQPRPPQVEPSPPGEPDPAPPEAPNEPAAGVSISLTAQHRDSVGVSRDDLAALLEPLGIAPADLDLLDVEATDLKGTLDLGGDGLIYRTDGAFEDLPFGESVEDSFVVSIPSSAGVPLTARITVTVQGGLLDTFEQDGAPWTTWDTAGSVSVVETYSTALPFLRPKPIDALEGDRMVRIDARDGSGHGVDNILTALGLPGDHPVLEDLDGSGPDSGSALWQTINVSPGDVISFRWAFHARGFFVRDEGPNDFALFVAGDDPYRIMDERGHVELSLATDGRLRPFGAVEGVASYTASESGPLLVGVAAFNDDGDPSALTTRFDWWGNSVLLVDDLRVNDTSAPDPVDQGYTLVSGDESGPFQAWGQSVNPSGLI